MKVGIIGAAGRMGQMLMQEVGAAADMTLVAGIVRSGSAKIEQIATFDSVIEAIHLVDGLIDFSTPLLTESVSAACAEHKKTLVVGTTGLQAVQKAALDQAAKVTQVVFAPNMSIGINMLLGLIAQAARTLGPDYDIEIVEAHHRHKKDAPSGTALALAEAIASATAERGPLDKRLVFGRHGLAEVRPSAQIGMHAIRGGDVVGDHTVMYCADGERIELSHRASSRQTFARGAVRALRWAATQPPGRLYNMKDVLGL